jgi:Icc protein
LLERVRGRCDLVLHGHRHVPVHFRHEHGERALEVSNAGRSTALSAFRVFSHDGARLMGARWVRAAPRPQARLHLTRPVAVFELG